MTEELAKELRVKYNPDIELHGDHVDIIFRSIGIVVQQLPFDMLVGGFHVHFFNAYEAADDDGKRVLLASARKLLNSLEEAASDIRDIIGLVDRGNHGNKPC